LSQLKVLLKIVLPLNVFKAEEVIELVRWVQMKNHRSYLSHRKKKINDYL